MRGRRRFEGGAGCPGGSDIVMYLRHELSRPEQEQVRQHLSQCPRCGACAEDFLRTVRVLEEARGVDVSDGFMTKVLARIPDSAWDSESSSDRALRHTLMREGRCPL